MTGISEQTVLNDRYRLSVRLGTGGMGTVYRAHDPTLDRDVAVKVLNDAGLGAEGRERLLHEAKAVAKLSHPNIVSVFDAGESDGSPYIVMELIDGDSLHDRPPPDLEEMVEIAAQICAALEHAHEHGIVHRDLKPENVLLDSEGTAKLMDFGIARSMASRLTSEGTVVGTVFYLAPEIALGHGYDGRADLYSLGVMLYELITGDLPFVGGDPVAVISQHMHASVVPPRARNSDIPPLLDALVVQLMSKERDARPGSASEVASMLRRSDLLDPAATGQQDVLVLDRIVRGRFVGREQELSEARALWSRIAGGEGQTLLISGEPGVGKTRLMRELSTHVEVTGGRTLVGACYAEGGAPYAPFGQIIRTALRSDGRDVPEFVLADLLDLTPDLRPYFPDVKANPPLSPEAEQQRLFENVVTFCGTLTEERPLLLLLDDAHWADSGSLSLMRHLSRRIRNKPILLAATYREIEIDEARPFREVLLDLNRERLARRLKLGRLSREQTNDLLVTIFQDEITPEFLEGIFRETEGNPFFIEEVCKALVESGQVFFRDGGWDRLEMEEIELPQSVREAIQSRLSTLPENDREALTMAAILGREFDYDTLSAASELGDDELITALEDAEKAQLIAEISGEGGATFSFAHALIPATLAESVRTLRRRRLHQRAAAAIEVTRPEDYEDLAYHYEEAGDDERARAFYILAGRRASEAYANQEAEAAFRAALDLDPTDEERPDLLAELAVVLASQGTFDEALGAWQRSIELYRSAGDDQRVAWCYARMSRAAWDSGDPRRGLEIAREGAEIIGEGSQSEEYADLLHELARAHFFSGTSEEGIPIGERALAMARSTGNVRIQCEVLATQGLLSFGDEERIGIAEAVLREAIELARAADLPVQEGRARTNLAHTLAPIRGDVRAARDELLTARELERRTGYAAIELYTGAQAAVHRVHLGELAKASEDIQRLQELMEGMLRPGIGGVMLGRARAIHRGALGFPEEQIEGMRSLQGDARRFGDRQSLWEIDLYLAEALVEVGRFDEAEEAALEVTQLGSLDHGSRGSPDIWLSIAQAKGGKLERSRQSLRAAREVLPAGLAAWHEVGLRRAGAHLAIAEERWQDSWKAFEETSDRLEAMDMRVAHGRLLMEWADGHLARGEAEDIERARALLTQARDEFENIGAEGYVGRLNDRLAELKD